MSFYNNVLEDKNKRITENQFFSYGTCCSQILRTSLSSPILHEKDRDQLNESKNSFEFTKSESWNFYFSENGLDEDKNILSLNNEELKFSSQTDNETKQKIENFHIMFLILEKSFEKLTMRQAFLLLSSQENVYGKKENFDIQIQNIVRKYFCFWRNSLRRNKKIMAISQNFNAFYLRNAFAKWRNISGFPKKIKILEIKFLLSTLNKIFSLRRKELFSHLVSNKDITYFESIIKNIIPLTNIFALISNKIRQNHALGFNSILLFSRKYYLQNHKKIMVNFFLITKNLVTNIKKEFFSKLIIYNYLRIKPLYHLKENLKKDFLKLNRKFHKIVKRQNNLVLNKSNSSKNLKIDKNFKKALEKISKALSKRIIILKAFAWSRIIADAVSKINSYKHQLSKISNRINGSIRHVSRSEEANSLLILRNSMCSPFSLENKENIHNTSWKTQEINEEFLEAMSFLNNI